MRYPVRINDDGSISFTKKTRMSDMADIELAIKEWIADNEKESDYATHLIQMLFQGGN